MNNSRAKEALDNFIKECVKRGAPGGTLVAAIKNDDILQVSAIITEYNIDPNIVKEAIDWGGLFGRKKTAPPILDGKFAEEVKRKQGEIFKMIMSQSEDSGVGAPGGFALTELMRSVPKDLRDIVFAHAGKWMDPRGKVALAAALTICLKSNPKYSKAFADKSLFTDESVGAFLRKFFPNIPYSKTTDEVIDHSMAAFGILSNMASSKYIDEIVQSAKPTIRQMVNQSPSLIVSSDVVDELSRNAVMERISNDVDEVVQHIAALMNIKHADSDTIDKVMRAIRAKASEVSSKMGGAGYIAQSVADYASLILRTLMGYADQRQDTIGRENIKNTLKSFKSSLSKRIYRMIEQLVKPKMEELKVEIERASQPKAASDSRPIVTAKKKDIGKGLRKHWKKHFKGRPKGSFSKAVESLKDKVENPEGLAAWLEHESTGKWPAEDGKSKAKKNKKKVKAKK